MSMEMLRWHIIAAHGRGIPAIVRVPGPNNHAGRGAAVWGAAIKHVLDGGCDGVVVPMVRSAEEVRAVVADCRYPTGGARPAPDDIPVSAAHHPWKMCCYALRGPNALLWLTERPNSGWACTE